MWRIYVRTYTVLQVSVRGSMRPEYILYGGDVVGESAVRTIPEIGSRVIHTFHIVNDGPWQADTVNLHIDWPYQVRTVYTLLENLTDNAFG